MSDDRAHEKFPALLLGDAVTAYLEWGKAPTPRCNDAAVIEIAPPEQGEELVAAVRAIIRISDQIEMRSTNLSDPTTAVEYKAKLRTFLPSLPDQAIDGLASRWFYNALW